jgi:hypothetical protein
MEEAKQYLIDNGYSKTGNNFVAEAKSKADVAIAFAQWVDNSSYTYYEDEGIWKSVAGEETKTGEELFEEFIRQIFNK